MMILTFYKGKNEIFATSLLFLSNLSVAMMDVIVDSLMVIQSRHYPEGGSEELQTFSWCMMGVGGIVGSLAAAILT